MFAVNGHIRRNLNKNAKKPFFSLRNIFIAVSVLVILAVVLVILLTGAWANASSRTSSNGDVSANVSTSSNVTTSVNISTSANEEASTGANGYASTSANFDNILVSSSQSTQNPPSGPDMFVFKYKGKVYAVNPSDSELNSTFLFQSVTERTLANAQLSRDKRKLYFFDSDHLVFDFDTREVTPVQNLPEYRSSAIMLKKPDLNFVLYGIWDEYNEYYTYIRHYSFDLSIVIRDYRTMCVKPYTPNVVGQLPIFNLSNSDN